MRPILCLFFLAITIITNSQTQLGIDIDGETAGDHAGRSVSTNINGSIVAIGAEGNDDNGGFSGHVRVYQNQGRNWIQLGQDIDGEEISDQSGWSVSLNDDGTILAIGAPFNDIFAGSLGQVRIFKFEISAWTQIGQAIQGQGNGDTFGWSVSLNSDGTRVAVGAPANDTNGGNSGSAQIFEINGNNWTQVGGILNGQNEFVRFGESLEINGSGDRIIVGSLQYAQVYQNQGGNWVQLGQDLDGGGTFANFGSTVSISANGNIISVKAFEASNESSVFFYELQGGTWVQKGLPIEAIGLGNDFGNSISLNGNGLLTAIGSPDANTVQIFQNQNGSWVQIGLTLEGEASNDDFGNSISMSSNGQIIAVGAPFNDGNGNGSGHVRVYDISTLLRLENNVFQDEISAYPTFIETSLTIYNPKKLEMQSFRLFDMIGRSVLNGQFGNLDIETTIDVRSLKVGMYVFHLNTDKGLFVQKLIKK